MQSATQCLNYTLLFETLKNSLEKVREVWMPNDVLKFINQISKELRIRNILLQKFLQTDVILFDQFKVYTVKFGKCFAEFKTPIALFKAFGS